MQATDVMRKVQAVQTNQCGLLACPPLVCFCRITCIATLACQHVAFGFRLPMWLTDSSSSVSRLS
jgi:hypothetical protein